MAETKQRSLKKLIKKAQTDPKVYEMLNNIKSTMSTSSGRSVLTPRERLKERLHQCRNRRGGRFQQQVMAEKVEERVAREKQKDEQVEKEALQTTINATLEDIKKQRKIKNMKLKKFEKKVGQITAEQYMEALRVLVEYETSGSNGEHHITDVQAKHQRNVVELYSKQKRQDTELVLEDSEDSETDDEKKV